MQGRDKALLIYQSIASNNHEYFSSLIVGHEIKWLNYFATDPEIIYLFDYTLPMELAIEAGNICIVRKLIEMGENPNPFLECAIISRKSSILKLLIDATSDIQLENNELLSLASERGDLDLVKILIERGLDVNNYDADYFWIHPVVKAIANAHTHIYQHLISCLVKNRDILNAIAIQEVARQGDIKTLDFLIDNGIDINAVDYLWGSTPLMVAVSANQSTMVSYLIDRGANINLQDLEGKTALMIAINNSSVSMVKELLLAGAEKNLKDVNNCTALELATYRKNIYITKLLKK
jgi:uncharacterized protein